MPQNADDLAPGGRWITVGGRHVYVRAEGPQDVTPPAVATPAEVASDGGYRDRDLHAEGAWPVPATKPGRRPFRKSYGGVIFDDAGRVLLREPTNHFGDLHWTFAQGGGKNGEHPLDTARREIGEETGHEVDVTGHVPGVHNDGYSDGYFYLMKSKGQTRPPGWETSGLKWATPEEAKKLIGLSEFKVGRDRDLALLDAAVAARAAQSQAALSRDAAYWSATVAFDGRLASRLDLLAALDATPGMTGAAARLLLDAARVVA